MHFGERLRQQRLARGVDLAQIAEDTRISRRYLEALESGDFKIIPGSIFARSFARQYAVHVGLDPASIETEIQQLFQQYPEEPSSGPAPSTRELVATAPFRTGPSRAGYWSQIPKPSFALVAALGACSLVYMGWQRVVLGTGKSIAIDASDAPNQAAGSPTTKLPTPEQLPKPNEPVPGTPVVTAARVGELPVPPAGTTGMMINVLASETTWVSIIANGKPVYSGVLEPNSGKVLKGVEHARMVIGNAGGIQVSTDGKPVGPIGPPGEVRILVLSPEGPRILRAVDAKPGAPAVTPDASGQPL